MKPTFSYLTRALFLFSIAAGAAAVAGCSTESTDAVDSEGVENSEEALVSCGAAKYNEALGHYKNAVAWSKERLSAGVCESDNGSSGASPTRPSKAVMTCAAFRDTIKNSPWAPALRTVLADSLTLRSLTGELLVIKDSEWQNWTGTEALLAKGVQFWAQSNGAYGSHSQLILGANGKGTFQYLDWDDKGFDVQQKAEPITYTVEAPNGPKGKRVISVKYKNRTDKYLLGVEAGYHYNDAPLFTITPQGAPGPQHR